MYCILEKNLNAIPLIIVVTISALHLLGGLYFCTFFLVSLDLKVSSKVMPVAGIIKTRSTLHLSQKKDCENKPAKRGSLQPCSLTFDPQPQLPEVAECLKVATTTIVLVELH